MTDFPGMPTSKRKSLYDRAEIEMQNASATNKRFADAEASRPMHPNANKRVRVR